MSSPHPDFRSTQRIFAAHLRDPANHPAPANIEARRLAVYRELIFNNLESFISNGFPVLRSLFDTAGWRGLVSDFIRHHRCVSPYFLEISQEFLSFLQDEFTPPTPMPGFLLELAHYEWVELALAVSSQTLPDEGVDPNGDLLDGYPVVSPLAWVLSYQYPVHRIGPGYRPSAPPATPTFLVAHRNRADEVKFVELNALSAQLLQLLAGHNLTGRKALQAIAAQRGYPHPQALAEVGVEVLRDLSRLGVLCGAATKTVIE